MPFRQAGSLRIYEFKSLVHPDLVQAVFTRHGGVSPQPWQSLNVGGTVGDERARVVENRRRSFEAVERSLESIYDPWQVHSANVLVVEAPRGAGDFVQADALLTDNPAVTLFMRYADCVPIFLFDPVRGAVGLVHAGWLGTVRRVAAAAVETMARVYGSSPSDILAALGPAVGPDHYPVGEEVAAAVRATFGELAPSVLQLRDGEVHFDLWLANRLQLEQAGVGNIETAGLCTACHVDDWYSHRAEGGHTGRFGALLALKA